MVNCYDCKKFRTRFCTSWTAKAKYAKEVIAWTGLKMPYCMHYDKFLHDMPDTDNNRTWIEDVWMVGCDYAHQMEHRSGHGHKDGSWFPALKKEVYTGRKKLLTQKMGPLQEGTHKRKFARKVI